MPFHKLTSFLLLILSGIIIISWEGIGCKEKIIWIISDKGKLHVNGSTNINNFSCVVTDEKPNDTISCQINKDASVTMNGEIVLDIFGFDCHNPLMTTDLRKTLRAKEYPNMKVHFLNLNKYPSMRGGRENIIGIVKIELSGITKTYEVNYQFFMDNKGILQLFGERKVNFSDFNLIPPRKLGGIIKVNDIIDVDFCLQLKVQ